MAAPIAFPIREQFAPAPEVEVHASLEILHELYNYNHWIFSRIRPFVHGSVCEVGCGIGNITQFLLNQERVVCLDPHAPSLLTAQHRFANHSNLMFHPHRLQRLPNDDLPAGSFGSVICLNVLEHIDDDVDALTRMRRLCRPDGRVVILVPAHMLAYGAMDRSFGHCRRYNRSSLRRVFQSAGLNIVYASYMNAVGLLGWLWEGRVMRRSCISVSVARRFDRFVPFLDALERIVQFPFGQSLVMVGSPM